MNYSNALVLYQNVHTRLNIMNLKRPLIVHSDFGCQLRYKGSKMETFIAEKLLFAYALFLKPKRVQNRLKFDQINWIREKD